MNLSLLHKQPWLITPEAFGVIYSAAQNFFKDRELPKPVESPYLSVEDGIGVIKIHGPMMRNPDLVEKIIFGATDTEEIMDAVKEACKRQDVQALFLDIDSPGGSVNGTPELANAVAAATKQKTVYAFSAGQMCSAAYWVASQCNAIYATPSARVGSIGVILPVIDSSAAFEQAGLKMEVFAAGKYKGAGTPGTSLTEDQRSWLQAEVEDIAAEFRAAVLSRGRQIPDSAMEGQAFTGRRAMRYNLAGVLDGKAEAMDKLRQLKARSVDTAATAMDANIPEAAAPEAVEQAKSAEVLLAEANDQITALSAKCDAFASELSAVNAERDQLASDLSEARNSVESISKKNEELSASEQDIEKRAALRAAQIVAETGNQQPAQVTAAADHEQPIAEQFAAIKDPAEQTAFWRKLTPKQKAQILNA